MYALMIGFQTGMRPGEIRALHWADLDFTNHVVFVVRYLKTGERSNARRGIPMSDQVAAALKAHREAGWGGDELVFVREDGKQLDSDALSHRTGSGFKAAGLGHLKDAYVTSH